MFNLVAIEDKITCTPDQINRDPSEVSCHACWLLITDVLTNFGFSSTITGSN